jgi:predicted TIM-barrel fold metal-dependent hydrolase
VTEAAPTLKLIDGWVNPNIATATLKTDVAYLFPGLLERRQRGTTLSQLLDEMDEAGVERAVLCAGYGGYDNLPWMEEAIAAHPDRFAGSLYVDPRTGMQAVRLLESTVRNSGVTMARVLALETQLPYDHAAYYPVYAKCVELGIPISVNVGIPGPRVPGKHQHPLSLDEVCYFFPDLTVVMSHGGDPWVRLCVKLMAKWPNLYYMTSAYAPKRLPAEIVDFINGRGADKVLWASDYPILEFRRCRDDILALPLRDEERRRKFAYDNAKRLLFDGQQTTEERGRVGSTR